MKLRNRVVRLKTRWSYKELLQEADCVRSFKTDCKSFMNLIEQKSYATSISFIGQAEYMDIF